MKNIKWIDILKGIGIIAVVIGHIWGGQLSRMMYVFHMPLFFFISGYLSKPTTDCKAFLIKKTKSLIIPYIVYLIPIYLVFYGLPELTFKGITEYIALPIIGGRFLMGSLGIFWFITCLYLTQQFMNYILSRFENKIVFYIMVFFLIGSYLNSLLFPNLWLPWNANVVLASAPIYYIGYRYKRTKLEMNSILILIGSLLVFGFSYMYPNNVYDMKNAKYGYPLITLISSIVVILGLKIISEYFSQIKILEKPLSELGKASMVIMYLHQPIQFIVNHFLSEDRIVRIIIAIIIPYIGYLLFKKFKYSDSLLLGNYSNFDIRA